MLCVYVKKPSDYLIESAIVYLLKRFFFFFYIQKHSANVFDFWSSSGVMSTFFLCLLA